MGYVGVFSVNRYDLTGTEVVVECVDRGTGGTGQLASLEAELDTGNVVKLTCDGAVLTAQYSAGGTPATPATIAFNATTMRWWRLRESGGFTYWQYSATGYATDWTTLHTRSSPINLSYVLIKLFAGTYSSIATPGVVKFDNFNLPTVPKIVAPASDVTVGTWTTDTGATTNLYAAIDEDAPPNDADYIQSVAGPANAVYEAALASVTDPASSVGHTLPVRAWLDTAGPPATITGELRQGANALSTPVSFTDTITTTPTTYDDTLSGAMADAITNYGDLRLRLTANQSTVAPTFVSATAGAVGTTGQLNVSWPSYAVGDIGLLFIERAAGDPAPTFAAASGFVAVTGAAVTTAGTGAVGTRLHTFWCRATSTGMGTVGINGSTDHQYAVMLVFRSCIATGDPWDVLATNFKISAGTPNTHPRVTTTVPNALIVCASGRDNDANNGIFSAQLNAGLTGVAERFDNGSNTAGGGGIGVWTGLKVAAGDTGETTSTMTSGLTANLTIALKPAPPASRVRVSWANLVVPAPPGPGPKNLTGSALGRATPTALIGRLRPLIAIALGTSTAAGAVRARRSLVGGGAGSSGTSVTLSRYTARWLTGSALGRATPSALLTRFRPLTGGSVGRATATGTIGVFLRPVRELTGAATGKGTVGTDFKWGNGQLYGAASTIWGATGVTIITGGPPPPGPKNLYATADGVSVTTASPTRRRPLVAATAGTAVVTASPTRRRPLIAASAGSATVTATLSKIVFRNLAGLAVGTSTTTATISKSTVFRNLAGLAVGTSSTTATPTRRRSLVVASVGTSAVTVALTRRRALVAASAGVATVTAAPGRKRVLVASAVGLSSTTAAVSAKRRLVAASAGAATTLASVDIAGSIYRALFGASVGRATNTGQTTRRRALIAASVGVSVTSGSPTRRRSMTVSALGRATVTAVPSRKLAMVALSAGRATVIAIPTRRRPLIAVSAGQATTTGAVDIITIPLTSVIWVVDHFEQGTTGTLVLWDTSVFQTSGDHAQVIWEEDVFKVYP